MSVKTVENKSDKKLLNNFSQNRVVDVSHHLQGGWTSCERSECQVAR